MDLSHPIFSSPVPFSSFNLTSITHCAMNSVTAFLVISSLALQTVLGLPGPSKVLQEREAQLLKRSVDSFIATESPIALTDLLCNIGSAGACVSGASSGIVIASPDRTNPDCNSPPLSSLYGFGTDMNQTFIRGLAILP
jgi:glucoamylase